MCGALELVQQRVERIVARVHPRVRQRLQGCGVEFFDRERDWRGRVEAGAERILAGGSHAGPFADLKVRSGMMSCRL